MLQVPCLSSENAVPISFIEDSTFLIYKGALTRFRVLVAGPSLRVSDFGHMPFNAGFVTDKIKLSGKFFSDYVGFSLSA